MADYYRFDDKSNPEPIASVLKRWANVGDKLYDSLVHAFYGADEIWDWREYTWTRETSRSGVSRDDTTHATYTDYQGPEKWDAIKKDMSQNGWENQDPLILVVGKNGCGKVGEGNHRLAIAKELGVTKIPVRFVFYTAVNSDEGQVKCLESSRLDEILLEMPSEMRASGDAEKSPTKGSKRELTAVIIKGNPEFISGNLQAEAFYEEVEKYLEGKGYNVTTDAGLAYTSPPEADLWIGHSKGSDRLRFAPTLTKTLAFSSGVDGAINHPVDAAWIEKFKAGESRGSKPPKEHYVFTQEMKSSIDKVVSEQTKSLSESLEITLLEELERVLLEAAIDKIKAKFPGREQEWDQVQQYLLDNGIKESQLPAYLNWIARQNQPFSYLGIAPLVVGFHRFKNTPGYWISDDGESLSNDINKFDAASLEDALRGVPDLDSSGATGDGDAEFTTKSGRWSVYVPKTQEQSISIANRGGPTSWCTAKETGENLFYAYAFGGVTLFYVLDNQDEANKFSIGTHNGQMDNNPQMGGMTVDSKNNAFKVERQKEVFQSDYQEIINFIDSYANETGMNSAGQKVIDALKSLPKWKHLVKDWKDENIYATLVPILRNTDVDVSKGVFLWILSRADNLTAKIEERVEVLSHHGAFTAFVGRHVRRNFYKASHEEVEALLGMVSPKKKGDLAQLTLMDVFIFGVKLYNNDLDSFKDLSKYPSFFKALSRHSNEIHKLSLELVVWLSENTEKFYWHDQAASDISRAIRYRYNTGEIDIIESSKMPVLVFEACFVEYIGTNKHKNDSTVFDHILEGKIELPASRYRIINSASTLFDYERKIIENNIYRISGGKDESEISPEDREKINLYKDDLKKMFQFTEVMTHNIDKWVPVLYEHGADNAKEILKKGIDKIAHSPSLYDFLRNTLVGHQFKYYGSGNKESFEVMREKAVRFISIMDDACQVNEEVPMVLRRVIEDIPHQMEGVLDLLDYCRGNRMSYKIPMESLDNLIWTIRRDINDAEEIKSKVVTVAQVWSDFLEQDPTPLRELEEIRKLTDKMKEGKYTISMIKRVEQLAKNLPKPEPAYFMKLVDGREAAVNEARTSFDKLADLLSEMLLVEAAIDKIKAKFPGREQEWDQAQQYLLDNGIKESQLPTYLNWLARQSQNSTEPLRDIAPLIVMFHIFKDKPFYWKVSKDINSFDRNSLEVEVEKMPDLNKKKPTGPIEPKFISSSGIWEVYVPMSEEESITIANMEGTTTWCTARTKGENLFNSYIFGDVVLFYVLDSRGRGNKYSIGTANGQIQPGQFGSVTVDKDNKAFTDSMQEKQFGEERKDILNFIQKFSDGIQGKHPARKKIEDGASSLPKWIHMTKKWQPKTISTNLLLIVRQNVPVAKDVFLHLMPNIDKMMIDDPYSGQKRLISCLEIDRWVPETYIKYRQSFDDDEIAYARQVIDGTGTFTLSNLIDKAERAYFLSTLRENVKENLEVLISGPTGQGALELLLSKPESDLAISTSEEVLCLLTNPENLKQLSGFTGLRDDVMINASTALLEKWVASEAKEFDYRKLDIRNMNLLCRKIEVRLSFNRGIRDSLLEKCIPMMDQILDNKTAIEPHSAGGPYFSILLFEVIGYSNEDVRSRLLEKVKNFPAATAANPNRWIEIGLLKGTDETSEDFLAFVNNLKTSDFGSLLRNANYGDPEEAYNLTPSQEIVIFNELTKEKPKEAVMWAGALTRRFEEMEASPTRKEMKMIDRMKVNNQFYLDFFEKHKDLHR